jgi:hypothetical protein
VPLSMARCLELLAWARRSGAFVVEDDYRAARPRPGLMLGFSGFPRQLIVPSAARLATLGASKAELIGPPRATTLGMSLPKAMPCRDRSISPSSRPRGRRA